MDKNSRHPLVEMIGLSQDMLASMGAIAVVSAHIESSVETSIWMIEGIKRDKKSLGLTTDRMRISDLIARLDQLGDKHDVEIVGKLIHAWCRAAIPCFKCRNNLFHGSAAPADGNGWIEFRNKWPILAGTEYAIQRKSGPSTFHASANTLALLEEAFQLLYDGLTVIWTAIGPTALDPSAANPQVINVALLDSWTGKLGRALSIGAELKDLAAAVTHEKY